MTFIRKRSKPLSLRLILIVPFVIQIFTAVGLVGYFSFRNGQRAINDLLAELQQEVNQRIDEHLDHYLALPQQLNQINTDAIELGLLDLTDLDASGRYFEKQVELFQAIGYSGYILKTGEGAGAGRWLAGYGVVINIDRAKQSQVYETDRQTNQQKLLETFDYDGLADVGYAETLSAGKPIWTKLYTIEEVDNYISVSANRPLYNANRDTIGVISADLLLSTINDFLGQLEISPSGRVFIIERDGLLLGSSTADRLTVVKNNQSQRVNVLASVDPLNRAIAQHLQQTFGSFTAIDRTQRLEFWFAGKRQFVQVMPWQDEFGLDWLVVTIIPESDFMAQINANTQTTILLCLATLGVATGLGLYTSHWITQPILKLIKASKAIASGNLNQSIATERVREFNVLAQAFNRMAEQLQESFTALETTNEVLESRVEDRTAELKSALYDLQQAQAHLIQAEKLSSLGQMVAGIAHEINNPVNFIYGNLVYANNYAHHLLEVIRLYQLYYPHPPTEIQTQLEAIDLNFIRTDLPELLQSMSVGADRIREIVLSLRNFSRLDEAELKQVDLHDGIDSTLMILGSRLKLTFNRPLIQVTKKYARLPLICCYAGQLNQVFMNILSNAIDALEEHHDRCVVIGAKTEPGHIWIQTKLLNAAWVQIRIGNNGPAIPAEVQPKLFDPFFTTKPFGKGTGLGLSISYQIVVQRHQGSLVVESAAGKGTTFVMALPINIKG